MKSRARRLLVVVATVCAAATTLVLAPSASAHPSSYCGHASESYSTIVGWVQSVYQSGYTSGGVHYHVYQHKLNFINTHQQTLACGSVPHIATGESV